MKYCLSVGLHSSYFDLAIVDSEHSLLEKRVCKYDKNMDAASSVYSCYKTYFSKYKIAFVGVGVSNNIEFNEDIIYNLHGAKRYNLANSLHKLFKCDVYTLDETMVASLTLAKKNSSKSLLYVVLDKKVTNSIVIDGDIVLLEDDINLKNSECAEKCNKSSFKLECLKKDLDDEFVGRYFFSQNEICKEIVSNWCKILSKEINKIIKVLPVEEIAFAGYFGEYYNDFNQYMKIDKNIKCYSVNNHKENVLIGISHLIFKDN